MNEIMRLIRSSFQQKWHVGSKAIICKKEGEPFCLDEQKRKKELKKRWKHCRIHCLIPKEICNPRSYYGGEIQKIIRNHYPKGDVIRVCDLPPAEFRHMLRLFAEAYKRAFKLDKHNTEVCKNA